MAIVAFFMISSFQQSLTGKVSTEVVTCIKNEGKKNWTAFENITSRQYHVSFNNQLVVEKKGFFFIQGKNCTVFDEENWSCNFQGSEVLAGDGNIIYSCIGNESICIFPVSFMDKVFIWTGKIETKDFCPETLGKHDLPTVAQPKIIGFE